MTHLEGKIKREKKIIRNAEKKLHHYKRIEAKEAKQKRMKA